MLFVNKQTFDAPSNAGVQCIYVVYVIVKFLYDIFIPCALGTILFSTNNPYGQLCQSDAIRRSLNIVTSVTS